MERWVLHLQTERSDVPQEVRMRRILKDLLRRYHFRCERIEHDPTPAPQDGQHVKGDTPCEK